MNEDNSRLPPSVVWRRDLRREVLNDEDQELIETVLELQLYGYRKPEQYTIGSRVLRENNGRADLLLLMRRNFTNGTFFFDLDRISGDVSEEESVFYLAQVDETISRLENQ
jgi:hypothetical protein